VISNISEARDAVLRLDGYYCVALRLDPTAGACYDAWGRWFSGYDPSGRRLEVDRVTDEPMLGSDSEDGIPAHLDVRRMVTLCPSHHRGAGPTKGFVWATAHRDDIRRYLAERGSREQSGRAIGG
jgi:hypothetical protein